MRHVLPKRPFFAGCRTHSPEDGPVELHDQAAAILVREGLADYCAPDAFVGDDQVAATPDAERVETASNPSPPRARKANLKRA